MRFVALTGVVNFTLPEYTLFGVLKLFQILMKPKKLVYGDKKNWIM
jgi:hypothetical protein